MQRLTFSAPATRDIWPIIMIRIVCLFFTPFMGLFNNTAQQQQRAQMMLQLEVELQATTELYSKCAPRRLTAVLPQSGLPARPTAAGRVLTRRATYLRSASWLFWGGGVYQAGAALLRQVHQSQIPRRRAHGTYVRTFHGAWCILHALWMLCATYNRACYMLHAPFMP